MVHTQVTLEVKTKNVFAEICISSCLLP